MFVFNMEREKKRERERERERERGRERERERGGGGGGGGGRRLAKCTFTGIYPTGHCRTNMWFQSPNPSRQTAGQSGELAKSCEGSGGEGACTGQYHCVSDRWSLSVSSIH